MSFVAKAVKKVFKVVKKVVKSKVFKIALIAAAVVFTAGLAAPGGFAAFSATMGSSGFFSAVGSTMASGMSVIAGGLGLGAAPAAGTTGTIGATGGLAAAESGAAISAAGGAISTGGAAASGTGLFSAASQAAAVGAGSGGLAMSTAGLAAGTSTVSTLAAAGATNPATQSFLAKLGTTVMSDSAAGTMLRSGITMGIQGYMNGKQREQEEYYRANNTVYGKKAFGSDGVGLDILSPRAGARPNPLETTNVMPEQYAASGQLPNQQAAGTFGGIQQGNYGQAPVDPFAQQQGLLQGAQQQPQQPRPQGGILVEQMGVPG